MKDHRPTPSEAIADAVRAYVRAGALDGPPQRLLALRGLRLTFRLTFRQADHLFTRYALAADLQSKRNARNR